MQDREIQALLKERGDAEGRVQKKDEVIETLMEQVNLLSRELKAYKANTKPLHDLIDLLEEEVNDAEHEAMALKDQREINHRRLDEKDNIIVGLRDDIAGMQRFIDRLETTNNALGIQAAEAEHRADMEKRGRLQLVMRM
jgi:chromosome segregation ATPase